MTLRETAAGFEVIVDPEFLEQWKIAKNVMRKDEAVLRELAKR